MDVEPCGLVLPIRMEPQTAILVAALTKPMRLTTPLQISFLVVVIMSAIVITINELSDRQNNRRLSFEPSNFYEYGRLLKVCRNKNNILSVSTRLNRHTLNKTRMPAKIQFVSQLECGIIAINVVLCIIFCVSYAARAVRP